MKKLTLLVAVLMLTPFPLLYADDDVLFKLHSNILAKKSPSCKYIEVCGELVKMDCNSALDGPIYYFNNIDGEILMICGGACMIPNPDEPLSCKECPLQAWQQCKIKKKETHETHENKGH